MEEATSSILGVDPRTILLFLVKQTKNFICPLTASSVKQYENILVHLRVKIHIIYCKTSFNEAMHLK